MSEFKEKMNPAEQAEFDQALAGNRERPSLPELDAKAVLDQYSEQKEHRGHKELSEIKSDEVHFEAGPNAPLKKEYDPKEAKLAIEKLVNSKSVEAAPGKDFNLHQSAMELWDQAHADEELKDAA